MNLTLKSRSAGNVYLIECAGRIVHGAEIAAFEAELERGGRDFTCFVLNFAELERLDSIGLGLIVRFQSSLRKRGGDIRLAAAPGFLLHVLELTLLSQTLAAYPTEAEAIRSFLPAA